MTLGARVVCALGLVGTFCFGSGVLRPAAEPASAQTSPERAVILKQSGCPLEITDYRARFDSESHIRSTRHPDQILHTVTYRNAADQAIVAVKLGMLAFDVFEDFMGKVGTVSFDKVEPGQAKKGSWVHEPRDARMFKRYGIGVIYVDRVRLRNGTIWRMDLAQTVVQLQKLDARLSAEDLLRDPEDP